MTLHDRLSQLLRLPLAGPAFKLYSRRKLPPPPAPAAPPKLLLVNLMPALGDTICYMAALEALRHAQPTAEITWLADSSMAPLIALHPAVDHVIPVTTPPSLLLRIPTLKTYYRLHTIARSLHQLPQATSYHAAIVLRGGADPSFSAHAIWILNLPRSFGYSHRVEPTEFWHNFGDPLLTDLTTRLTTHHEAARPLALFAAAGLIPAGSNLNLDQSLPGLQSIASRIPAETLHTKLGLSGRPFVVLAPGASVANRAWPSTSFQALCRIILAATPLDVVIVGGSSERTLAHHIAAGSPSNRIINAAGQLGLPELVALLSHARACVGNDSGPGHVAGALGIPVISLHTQPTGSDPWHPRSSGKGRPLGPNVTVLQPRAFLPPCRECCVAKGPHCITQITVDTVWQALQNSLQQADSH